MLTKTRSFVSSGKAYYKHTGRYNEFTKKSKYGYRNDSPSALTQNNLTQHGDKTAAAVTMKNVKKELGL